MTNLIPKTVQLQINYLTHLHNLGSSYLIIPSDIIGFLQISGGTEYKPLYEFSKNKELPTTRRVKVIKGILQSEFRIDSGPRICPCCGATLHKHGTVITRFLHVPNGLDYTVIELTRTRFKCSNHVCGETIFDAVPFKAANHFITTELNKYIETELSRGLTLKEISIATGVNRNVIKDIDVKRLRRKYTTVDASGKRTLIKPEKQAKYLGIDEFKLHDGHKYATLIADMDTGHILWLQEGKKKQVVYDFIDHVGLDYMSKVKAISADMNSDFQEAFLEKCPHLDIVFDYFHIKKNFNDKVVNEVRKDILKRLLSLNLTDEAKTLKNSKYIIMSNRTTLRKKDDDALNNKIVSKGSELFNKNEIIQTGGKEERYDSIITNNYSLFVCDYVKNSLDYAYKLNSKDEMAQIITDIIRECRKMNNNHFIWFSNLLKNHFDGIIAHAKYKISNGKLEGINRKIKTIRRKSYGLPDDEYFFLKIIDASRNSVFCREPTEI